MRALFDFWHALRSRRQRRPQKRRRGFMTRGDSPDSVVTLYVSCVWV